MHLIGKEGPMRRQAILLVILAGLTACGPWIITPERPETPETPADASAAGFADERALLAERFELDELAFVATDDGLVFVVESGDELHLLLSRDGSTEKIEILARVECHEVPEGHPASAATSSPAQMLRSTCATTSSGRTPAR